MIRYEMPKDVRTFVLHYQLKLKLEDKQNRHISQQQTISKIITEFKKLTEKTTVK